MNRVAGANLSTLAVWAALVLTGILAGSLASRWRTPDRTLSPRIEGLLLGAAAAGVVAWFAQAGALFGNSAAHELLAAFVPIETKVGLRLAVLWSTLPGGALTMAVALLVTAALTTPVRADNRDRWLAVMAVAAFGALIVAAWFGPSPNATADRIPVFVQSASAALAPLFALSSLIGLAVIFAAAAVGNPAPRPLVIGTWIVATLAVAAEQAARSGLGIGPRDAVVLGSASAGLILWLLTSALLHRRVQALLLRNEPDAAGSSRAANAAHAGAVLLVVSFALHALASRSTVSLAPGASVDVTDAFRRTWQLAHQGVSRFDAEGVDITSVAIESRDPTGQVHLLAPEIQDHHGRDGRHLENSISLSRSATGALQTLRIVLLEADSLDVASVRVTFMPVPILWPLGVGALLLSAALALAAKPRPPSPRE